MPQARKSLPALGVRLQHLFPFSKGNKIREGFRSSVSFSMRAGFQKSVKTVSAVQYLMYELYPYPKLTLGQFYNCTLHTASFSAKTDGVNPGGMHFAILTVLTLLLRCSKGAGLPGKGWEQPTDFHLLN